MPAIFPATLLAWCVIWTVLAGVAMLRGATARPGGSGRSAVGFWSMTLFWIAIDVGIIGWAALDPVADVSEFRHLLLVNGCLDVVYVIVGFVMIRSRNPMVGGFARAIIVQGGFLLVFDFIWWWLLAGSVG